VSEVTGAITSAPQIATATGAASASSISTPVVTSTSNGSYILGVVASVASASSSTGTLTAPASTTMDAQGSTTVTLSNNVDTAHLHDTANQASAGATTARTVTSSANMTNSQSWTVVIAPPVGPTSGTTAQVFYPSASAQDQTISGANVIDKLVTSAPATNSATTNTYASASTQTVIPYTSTTTATDTTQNNGWAFNNAGVDGLSSTTTDKRVFPAGVWAFQGSLTFGAPALVATATATVVAKVYRVVTGGGARSLLFTATSAVVSSTATGAFAWSASSASQPAYVMAAGEVVEVGFTIASANTLNTLSQSTSTIINFTTGSTTFVTVPTPGVRTQYSLSGSGVISTQTFKKVEVGAKRSSSINANVFKTGAVSLFKNSNIIFSSISLKRLILLPKQDTVFLTAIRQSLISLIAKQSSAVVTANKKVLVGVSKSAAVFANASALTFAARFISVSASYIANAANSMNTRLIPKQASLITSAVKQFRVGAFKSATSVTTAVKQVSVAVFKSAPINSTAVYAKAITKNISANVTASAATAKFLNLARSFNASVSATGNLLLTLSQAIFNRSTGGDYPLVNATKSIAGFIRNTSGTIFTAGAKVLLIRDSDSRVVQTQISAADGSYSFPRDASDPNDYRVQAFETSTNPAQQGSTPAGILPT
jgi:hypothetical protein